MDLALLIADDGSFVVAPNIWLVLWTVFVFVFAAAVMYGIVRLALWIRQYARDR